MQRKENNGDRGFGWPTPINRDKVLYEEEEGEEKEENKIDYIFISWYFVSGYDASSELNYRQVFWKVLFELFEEYFEKTDRKYATRNNLNSVKLPKVKLETGRKGFYFLAAKAFNALPPKLGAWNIELYLGKR